MLPLEHILGNAPSYGIDCASSERGLPPAVSSEDPSPMDDRLSCPVPLLPTDQHLHRQDAPPHSADTELLDKDAVK